MGCNVRSLGWFGLLQPSGACQGRDGWGITSYCEAVSMDEYGCIGYTSSGVCVKEIDFMVMAGQDRAEDAFSSFLSLEIFPFFTCWLVRWRFTGVQDFDIDVTLGVGLFGNADPFRFAFLPFCLLAGLRGRGVTKVVELVGGTEDFREFCLF